MGAPQTLKNSLGFSAPLRFFSPARGVSQSLRSGDLFLVSLKSIMAVLLNTRDVPSSDLNIYTRVQLAQSRGSGQILEKRLGLPLVAALYSKTDTILAALPSPLIHLPTIFLTASKNRLAGKCVAER